MSPFIDRLKAVFSRFFSGWWRSVPHGAGPLVGPSPGGELLYPADIALGDRYAIKRQLGRGGMATVFLAEDRKHRRTVAIKVLRPEVAAALGAERFLHEIEIVARLSHPHILPLYDSGEASGLLYFVMPHVRGESLRERLNREKQLPVDDALDIARHILDAIDYAHGEGIVHRDLKPENILLSRGHALVADFGVGRVMDSASAVYLSQPGIAIGTPEYMSPEQVGADRAVDGRSDLYSISCMVFEMLTGQPPFVGRTTAATMLKHLRDPVPDVRSDRPSVPSGVETAVLRALAKSPENRFATGAEFGRALTIGRMSQPLIGEWTADESSIAVLPFTNLSTEPENEYFSDGITEEIINALTKVPGLRVTARASVFTLKGKSHDVRELGEKLNVDHVLEGSVRRAGKKLRVNAQLVDAAQGYQLWSERYDREFEDVFAIQDEIAEAIAGKLRTELTVPSATRPRTVNLEAYDAYLRGRFYFDGTLEGYTKSIEYFGRAIALDPTYAPAYTSLADTYFYLGLFEMRPPKQAFSPARDAALKALELDDTLAEAHASLGFIKFWFDWDWTGAEAEMQRALELDPNSAISRQNHGVYLATIGRADEGVAEGKRALDLDPLLPSANQALAYVYYLVARFEDATEQIKRTLELSPGFALAHWTLGMVYLHQGRNQEAVQEFERATTRSSGSPFATAGLGHAYAVLGDREAAREIVRDLEQRSKDAYTSPATVAQVYIGLGEHDRAMELLEQAYTERATVLVSLRTFPWFDPLRSDSRFQDLLHRMEFPA